MNNDYWDSQFYRACKEPSAQKISHALMKLLGHFSYISHTVAYQQFERTCADLRAMGDASPDVMFIVTTLQSRWVALQKAQEDWARAMSW